MSKDKAGKDGDGSDEDEKKEKSWIQRFGKGYEPYFEEAAAEGFYPVKWTSIAIFGAAKSGKTGMVNLFLNKLPAFSDEEIGGTSGHNDGFGEDDKGYGSESDNQDPATEVRLEEMENKEEYNEYRYFSRRVDPKYIWKVYDVDSLYLKLHDIIHEHLTNPPPDITTLYSIYAKRDLKKKFPPPPPPPKVILPEGSLENVVEVSARRVLGLLPVQLVDLEKIEKSHWIYVADCGGETLFLDICPALMRFFCINLSCYKVIDDLDSPVTFQYCVDGTPTVGRCYRQITNRQLIKLIFAGKIEVRHPKTIGVVTGEYNRRPYFSVVSSFYDTYQGMEKENKVKESIADKNAVFHEDLKTFAHVRIDLHSIHEQVLFPFNTSARQKKDLKAVERFKRIANHCYMEVNFPIRWYLFFLQVNEVKGSSRVMISFNECIKMAALVGIHSVEVVRAALEYFSDMMLILYYPTVMPDVIFLSQKRIFDKLSEVIAIFVDVHTGTFNPHHVAMLKTGVLDRDLLDDISYGFIPNFFTPDKFLELLYHLYIIESLGNNKYLLPFLLGEIPDVFDHVNNDTLEPLMIFWKKGCIPLPTGFFLTFVHYLWRLEDPVFKRTPISENFRNKFVFDCPAIDAQVILFESDFGMGVSQTGKLEHCIYIRETMMVLIEKVIDILGWRAELKVPKCGFLCRMTNESCAASPTHVARITKTFEFTKCKDYQSRTYRDLVKDFTQMPWYKNIGEIIEERSRLHARPIQWREAYRFFRKRSRQWLDLAYRLSVSRLWIDQLRNTWSITYDQRYERVCKEYVNTQCSPLTWEFMLAFLKDDGDEEHFNKAQTFLEEERRKYEESD